VQPQVAVEILDVLKNIFDIQDCIFIMAIDYEVVVKGLETKFGVKTEENEREFRQYFDKIIQIPFTMPVGSYKDYLDKFIKTFLGPLRLDSENIGPSQLKRLSDVAHWTTEGVPRAIKRIINTTSLLLAVDRADLDAEQTSPDDGKLIIEQRNSPVITFIVVALHINFPEICRVLMANPKFTTWSFQECQGRFSLLQAHFDDVSNQETQSVFTEEWKKVIYCLCAKNRWLQARAEPIVKTFMALLAALNEACGLKNLHNPLDESAFDKLNKALKLVRVVSVDLESDKNIDESDYQNDNLTHFFKDLHRALKDEASWSCLPDVDEDGYIGIQDDNLMRDYTLTIYADSVAPFSSIAFVFFKKENKLSLAAYPFGAKFYNTESNRKKFRGALQRQVSDLPLPRPEVKERKGEEGWYYLKFAGFTKQDLGNFGEKEAQVLPLMAKGLELFRDAYMDIKGA
jgi:hypothetical protein